jgi:hypothetical protein
MLYAEIIDGVPKRWPITGRQLRNILHETTFLSGEIIQEDLEGTDWWCIDGLEPQEYKDLIDEIGKDDPDHIVHLSDLVPDPTAPSGFKRSYKRTEITEPERREHRLAAQWAIIKRQRHNRLIDSDKLWFRHQREVTLDLPRTVDIIKLETYRQALVDLPDVQDDPFSIVWPLIDFRL